MRSLTPRHFAQLTRAARVAVDHFCAAVITATAVLTLCFAIEYLSRPGVLL